MDFEEVLVKRRSIRKYLSVPVGREIVSKMIEAGNEAPCAGNIQNWRFLIVEDEEAKKKIAEACLEQMWIATAPSIIVICSEMDKIRRNYGLRGEALYSIQNCAAAAENMILMATNLGVSTCWVSAFDENAIARVIDLPDNCRPQIVLPIGYAAEKPIRPMRFSIEDVTYIRTYGGPGKIEFIDTYLRNYHFINRAQKGIKAWWKGLMERFFK